MHCQCVLIGCMKHFQNQQSILAINEHLKAEANLYYVPLSILIKVQNPKYLIWSVYLGKLDLRMNVGFEKCMNMTKQWSFCSYELCRQKLKHSALCWPTSTFQCWWKKDRNGMDRKENKVQWEKIQNCGDSQKKTQTKDKRGCRRDVTEATDSLLFCDKQLSWLINVP